jgi:two-component system NtrC family sensor kinase
MSGETILVIDDRRENLLFLANSVLRPEGYEVITATDGKQGFDKALAEKPDLIITDLKMPRMSGLELMAALRREGVYIPVILTTFYGSEQAAIQAFRLGAKDYIIKPYEVQEMLESVERALIEQRLRREAASLKEGTEVDQHLGERVRQLHNLCGIGRSLNALQIPDEVMRVAVEAAMYLSDAEGGQLFLVNPETQQLELRAVRGPSESRARCVRQPGADQFVTLVAQSGKTTITAKGGGKVENPRLAVPLRAMDEVIGVLVVVAKPDHGFTENDSYQVGILAGYAAVAVVNARTIENLKIQLATTVAGMGTASNGTPLQSAVPDLTESITEAKYLSRELRNLASAAQALAARLEVQTGSS